MLSCDPWCVLKLVLGEDGGFLVLGGDGDFLAPGGDGGFLAPSGDGGFLVLGNMVLRPGVEL